jgi:hypothetical protein
MSDFSAHRAIPLSRPDRKIVAETTRPTRWRPALSHGGGVVACEPAWNSSANPWRQEGQAFDLTGDTPVRADVGGWI